MDVGGGMRSKIFLCLKFEDRSPSPGRPSCEGPLSPRPSSHRQTQPLPWPLPLQGLCPHFQPGLAAQGTWEFDLDS